jgi:hypothetical protein
VREKKAKGKEKYKIDIRSCLVHERNRTSVLTRTTELNKKNKHLKRGKIDIR